MRHIINKIHVAAGIILRDQQVFISKRSAEQHQGNKWEFPGGKVEQGETAAQGLIRELREEVNIQVEALELFQELEFDYGDKVVQLDFFLVTRFSGQEMALEGQETAWVDISDLIKYTFPAANQPIVEKLIEQYQSSN